MIINLSAVFFIADVKFNIEKAVFRRFSARQKTAFLSFPDVISASLTCFVKACFFQRIDHRSAHMSYRFSNFDANRIQSGDFVFS